MADQIAQVAAAVRREHARRRQPPEPQREQDHEHDAEPEDRHAGAEERRDGAAAIEERVRPHRRRDPESDPDHARQHEPARGQHERRLEPVEHFGEHRTLRPERASEIAAHDVREPSHVLDGQGLGEPELGAKPREVGLRGLRAEHDLGRVTRRQVQDHEDHDRHAGQHRHQQEEPAGDVTFHRRLAVTSVRWSPRGDRSSDGA